MPKFILFLFSVFFSLAAFMWLQIGFVMMEDQTSGYIWHMLGGLLCLLASLLLFRLFQKWNKK